MCQVSPITATRDLSITSPTAYHYTIVLPKGSVATVTHGVQAK